MIKNTLSFRKKHRMFSLNSRREIFKHGASFTLGIFQCLQLQRAKVSVVLRVDFCTHEVVSVILHVSFRRGILSFRLLSNTQRSYSKLLRAELRHRLTACNFARSHNLPTNEALFLPVPPPLYLIAQKMKSPLLIVL